MTGLKQAWKQGYFEVSFEGWKFFVWTQVFVAFGIMILIGNLAWGKAALLVYRLFMLFMLPLSYFFASAMFVRPEEKVFAKLTDEDTRECIMKFIVAAIFAWLVIIFL